MTPQKETQTRTSVEGLPARAALVNKQSCGQSAGGTPSAVFHNPHRCGRPLCELYIARMSKKQGRVQQGCAPHPSHPVPLPINTIQRHLLLLLGGSQIQKNPVCNTGSVTLQRTFPGERGDVLTHLTPMTSPHGQTSPPCLSNQQTFLTIHMPPQLGVVHLQQIAERKKKMSSDRGKQSGLDRDIGGIQTPCENRRKSEQKDIFKHDHSKNTRQYVSLKNTITKGFFQRQSEIRARGKG